VGPVLSRLHVGRYRVIYEIGDQVISVRRIDRVCTGH
jgi:mRNA-degrading endonuclease RelE of RelBE toxin-antitoxin system